jgi:hypothetical protein
MSNRRRPGKNPWTPWIQPRDQRPPRQRIHESTQDNGRTRIDAHGADAGAIAAIETFRKNGATRVEFGWSAPGYPDEGSPPPGVPVTWWFRVTYRSGRVEQGRSEPTADHARGALEAAAQILRRTGSTMTIHDPEAN